MKISKTKTAMAVAATLAVSTGTANANTLWDFEGYFEFYDAAGAQKFTVDTDGDGLDDSRDNAVTGSFDLAAGTGTFDTTNPFNAVIWHADVDTMFQPAQGVPLNTDITWTWTNHTAVLPSGVGTCRVGVSIDGCAGLVTYDAIFPPTTNNYTFQLTNAGQFAAGVFFDWSTNNDIPVLAILQGLDDPSDGVFDVVSTNGAGPAPAGTAMITDPFPGQTPAFGGTMTCTSCEPPPIPVPAAVWLFGSGLLGLVGVARRKTKA